jgi:hypothetical protein
MSVVTEHELKCDLLVAGGGIAGVCCALAAARHGVQVILCQDRSVLGGNASSEVRMHIVGANGLRGGEEFKAELREGGIVEELRLDLAVRNPQRSPSMMDLLLYEKCRAEPNLTLLLNTAVVAADLSSDRIRAVTAERVSTEDRFRIAAEIFVDATGDGRLGVEAGAPFRSGRESRVEFGEKLAQLRADDNRLGSTLLFQARRHDRPMPFVAPSWVRKFQPSDFKLRPFGQPGSDLGLEYGYWWVEWGGCLDTIKDNERIRDELLAIMLGVWNHIKNESGADASHWALDWFGFLPGKRESRRFIGQHVLSEADVFGSRDFPDAIAFGGWPIDTHPPEGVDAPDEPPCDQHHLPYLYNIPLRACVSAGPGNLMFAGRNISATHIAFASTRVMATCGLVGQGVGTSAAIALRARVAPRDLASRQDLVSTIQQQLLRDDCYLVGLLNRDESDLARKATITGSSAQPDAGPESVVSGQTRSVHGETTPEMARNGRRPQPAELVADDNLWNAVLAEASPGQRANFRGRTVAPPERCFPGLHRWMSDPAAGWPATLELRWSQAVKVREIQLVFDTGQHRYLTLSQADGYTRKMQWGRAQTETVRDYGIEIETDAGWRQVVSQKNNYQRLRRHVLAEAMTTRALRLVVTATNGVDHARVFEVRVYS